jgi:hypothetical protein
MDIQVLGLTYQHLLFSFTTAEIGSRESSVGIETRRQVGRQTNQGSISSRVRYLSSVWYPDWLWGSPSFLHNGYRG